MKSIICLVLGAVSCIMINVIGEETEEIAVTQCIPNGCYYDLAEDLTKQIECKPDGSLEILYFHGNNGCESQDYLLPQLTFESPLVNPCCIADEISRTCNSNLDCHNGDYCRSGECVVNTCWRLVTNGECDTTENCPAQCICEPYESISGGLCVPQNSDIEEIEESEASPTTYSIIINNKNIDEQEFNIFQINPMDTAYPSGFPIVFASQPIEGSGGNGNIKWDVSWGLSWAAKQTGCTPLAGDIIYSRNGAIIDVDPNNKAQNGASITYNKNGLNSWTISPEGLENLDPQTIGITTDGSFDSTTADSQCLTVSVTMGGESIFAMDGEPHQLYSFELLPSYYLTTAKFKTGETVKASAITNAYKVPFINGHNNMECDFDTNYEFKCNPIDS